MNNNSYPIKKTTEGGTTNYSMVRLAFSIKYISLGKKNNMIKTEPSQTGIMFKQRREMESTITKRKKRGRKAKKSKTVIS